MSERHYRGAHEIFGDEIREHAALPRQQYPRCSDDFIVCTLEYDLGMRAATIRKALNDTANAQPRQPAT